MADTTERWLPVVGYEGLYEVSDLGRVRGLDRVMTVNRVGFSGLPVRGQVLKATPTGHRCPHLGVTLYRSGVRRHHRVHHLVLEAFIGPRPSGLQGLHWDDVPTNNRLENLRWATAAENMRDKVRNGRDPQANRERCPRAHPLKAPNLVTRGWKRSCLACDRAHATLKNARTRRGIILDLVEESNKHYLRILDAAGLDPNEDPWRI